MSTVIIASLFDSPWMVAVILLVGAIANWLSSRRQKKLEEKEGASPKADQPQPEFDMEETLRRLLGGEEKKPVAPPPIPRTTQSTPPPIKAWIEEDDQSSGNDWMKASRPQIQPSPVAWIDTKPASAASGQFVERPPGRTAVHVAGAMPIHELRRGTGTRAAYWRNPKSARQAFVASLVFGPPKGMEN